MEHKDNQKVKRGEIYLYDFGNNEGSIQNGIRPVLSYSVMRAIRQVQRQWLPPLLRQSKNGFCPRTLFWAEISDWMSLQWLCSNN